MMGDGLPQILMVETPSTIGEGYEPLLVSAQSYSALRADQ